MAPARRSTIPGRNASVSSCTAATLSWTIAASLPGAASRTRPYEPKPALLHRPTTTLSEPRTAPISAPRCAGPARAPGPPPRLGAGGGAAGPDERLDSVLGAQPRGELLEAVGAAGGEHDVVAERG